MIDLVQNRLSGGDTPKDLRKMYGRGTIAKILNFAYNAICINNAKAAADMAIEYTFTPVKNGRFYDVTLYPQPIAGTLSIFQIYDDKTNYNIQDKVMADALTILRGNNKKGAVLYGNRLRFKEKPTGDVVVTQVPNVYQMEDDDILYAGEVGTNGEMELFQMCLQILMNPVYQDELNNNAVDVQQQSRGN